MHARQHRLAPAAVRTRPPGPRVPAAVREPLERALHTDFSDVVLRERSPVPVAAGALALVRDLEVHLSPALGGLDRPLARHALAHEFVHLTQPTTDLTTRTVGGQLVAHSPARERDADARAAKALRGGAEPHSGPLAAPHPAPAALCFKLYGKNYDDLTTQSGTDLVALRITVATAFNETAITRAEMEQALAEIEAEEASRRDPVTHTLPTRGKRTTQAVNTGKEIVSKTLTTATHAQIGSTALQEGTGLSMPSQVLDVTSDIASVALPVSVGLSGLNLVRTGRKAYRAHNRSEEALHQLQSGQIQTTEERDAMAYAMSQNDRSYKRNRTQAVLNTMVLGSGIATLATGGYAAPALVATAALSSANSMRGPLNNLRKRIRGTAGVERLARANDIYNFARAEAEANKMDGPFYALLKSSSWHVVESLGDLKDDSLQQAIVSKIYRKLRSR